MADRILPSATEARMAPGFRFRPSDEELISYYLKRKVQGKPFALDLIGEVDVYKQEHPSHLPEKSRMKTKDQEWYFFTKLEKYELSSYRKRSTTEGYWRDRGSGTEIKRGGGGDGQVIGKVNRLVFNTGRPPENKPTDWVIHEYQLLDNNDDGLGLIKTDAYVLCRLSNTSGKLNAPFSEQEWDDVSGGSALVPSLVLANRINEKIHQQESDFGIKNLFDLNELPREFDDPKTVDQDDACLPHCALNNEAPLPFIQFKRKRQIDSSFGSYANASQTTPLLEATSETALPSAAGAVIAPGFRFNPTDEELISYYLKRKVQGKPFPLDLIGELDVYKHEPSDLPEKSKMKTKERAWFFFTTPEKHGNRIMRATSKGYWNKRGHEKKIKRGGGDEGQVVDRYPNYQPTNWVIHEYQLVDNDGLGLKTDAYVLCRLSDKNGNINAPFSEQEWDDVSGGALVTSQVHTTRINENIQQESDFGIKNLFDLNELPREFDDPKTVDQDDACPLPCALNKEASLPFIQFKRKRQIDYSGSYANSSQTTHQDHCSSPKPTSETIPSTTLEESGPEPVDTTMVVPTTSSYTELIKDLQKEREQFAALQKRYKLDMTNSEMIISDLVGKNNALRMEIEELTKKNSNKEQGS